MYKTLIIWLLEMIGLGGLVLLLSYIKWVHLIFGGVLALLGAFFPAVRVPSRRSVIKPETGDVQIKFDRVAVVARGTLRALVVIAGIVVIVGSIVEGYKSHEQAERKAEKVAAKDFGLTDEQMKRLNELASRIMLEEIPKRNKTTDSDEPAKK